MTPPLSRFIRWLGFGAMSALLAAPAALRAQATESTYLTDKIYQGSGVIDLLKDVSPATLAAYFQGNSTMLLAVDVNENASGNESADSLGVAIKSVNLILSTTSGDFSFSDVFSNTSALITTKAGTTGEYYTLFGQAGSSNLTSSTTGFDLSQYDDLLEIRNVAFSGTILSAKLVVNFVDTAVKSAGANETFFDYSGGFEDFALISRIDAVTLESAGIGLAAAPSGITYETAPVSETILAPVAAPDTTAGPTTDGGTANAPAPAPAPAAPVPPFVLLLGAAVLFALGAGGRLRHTEAA